jgi:hypothetical protein
MKVNFTLQQAMKNYKGANLLFLYPWPSMWVAGDIHTVTGLVSPETVIYFTV